MWTGRSQRAIQVKQSAERTLLADKLQNPLGQFIIEMGITGRLITAAAMAGCSILVKQEDQVGVTMIIWFPPTKFTEGQHDE